ncbi:hypothetical protein NMY22_g14196 [Coprinellus aureogranulatus]|nr:hypothetical protein NMY22_g14196 [Coprinellus aureogranulatus]
MVEQPSRLQAMPRIRYVADAERWLAFVLCTTKPSLDRVASNFAILALCAEAIKVTAGQIPGLVTNSFVHKPREVVKSGRCTELESSIVNGFERQFALDRNSLSLPPLIKHNQQSSIRNDSTTNLSRRQSLQNPIKTYIHIIQSTNSTTEDDGSISDTQVQQQMTTLNNAFMTPAGNHYLLFVLEDVDRTVNPDWFNNGGPDTAQQAAMKSALRKGGRADLNIYTVNFTGDSDGLLGYATFPQSYNTAPSDDGIVILYKTFPGGTIADYNTGMTAVHETGHWVGLYHTFQGSCTGQGDFVDDTMPEGIPSQGCPEGRITCPVDDATQGGVDPIHNYMDYSVDSCMTEFTAGQMDRARQQLIYYRGIEFH